MSIKEQILKGPRKSVELHVPELETDDFDGVVLVRPLTEGEQEEVDHHMVAGQTAKGTTEHGKPQDIAIDLAESSKGQQKARRLAVAYGLSVEEDWKPAEVAKLPPAAVKTIHDKVSHLTGRGGLEEEARRFRGDTAGSEDRAAAPDGDPAGDQAG